MAYQITGGKVATAKKVVVYGPEGIGKSTFASNFPDPVFIDTEHSTDEYDFRRFPYPDSFEMLLGEVRQVRDDPGCCRTLVIDTADWAEKLCTRDLLARTKKHGIEDFGYGKGYVYLSEDFGTLLALLEDIKSRGVNVVLTAHAWLRKFEQPDEMGSYDRWERKLSKHIAPMVKEWADIILFANYKTYAVATDDSGRKFKAQGGARVMYTSHHPCWDAKNRHGLPAELPFDYTFIAQLFDSSKPAPQPAPKGAEADIIPTPAKAPAKPAAKAKDPVYDVLTAEQLTAGGIPAELAKLMADNGVCEADIRNVVGNVKGYFPADMPVKDYPADFVQGVLIAAWPQVYKQIQDSGDVPF